MNELMDLWYVFYTYFTFFLAIIGLGLFIFVILLVCWIIKCGVVWLIKRILKGRLK